MVFRWLSGALNRGEQWRACHRMIVGTLSLAFEIRCICGQRCRRVLNMGTMSISVALFRHT